MSRLDSDKPEHASGAIVYDPQQALERCFGNAKTFGKMVQHFLTESPALLETMRAALREQRGRDLARAAHRLGGTLVYLAARPATDAVEHLERLGERNEFPAAERHWECVECELQRLRAALQQDLTGHRDRLPNNA